MAAAPPPMAQPNPRSRMVMASITSAGNANNNSTDKSSPVQYTIPPPPRTTVMLRSEQCSPSASPSKAMLHGMDGGKENFPITISSPAKGNTPQKANVSYSRPFPLTQAANVARSPARQERGKSPSPTNTSMGPQEYAREKFFEKYSYMKSYNVKPKTPSSAEKKIHRMRMPATRGGALGTTPNELKEALRQNSRSPGKSPSPQLAQPRFRMNQLRDALEAAEAGVIASQKRALSSIAKEDSGNNESDEEVAAAILAHSIELNGSSNASNDSPPASASTASPCAEYENSLEEDQAETSAEVARNLLGDIAAAGEEDLPSAPVVPPPPPPREAHKRLSRAPRSLLDIIGEVESQKIAPVPSVVEPRASSSQRASTPIASVDNEDDDDQDDSHNHGQPSMGSAMNEIPVNIDISDEDFTLEVITPAKEDHEEEDAEISQAIVSARGSAIAPVQKPKVEKANEPETPDPRLNQPWIRRAAYRNHGGAKPVEETTSGLNEQDAANHRRATQYLTARARLEKHYLDEYHHILVDLMTTPFARLDDSVAGFFTKQGDKKQLAAGRRCMLQEVLEHQNKQRLQIYIHYSTYLNMKLWMSLLYLSTTLTSFEEHMRFILDGQWHLGLLQIQEDFNKAKPSA